jgi:integrase
MSDVNIRVRILNKGTPNERKVWQLDYFDNNVDNDHPHGHRHQPHYDSRDEARKERKRIRREVEDAIHAAGDGSTIAELRKLYLQQCKREGLRPQTLDNYADQIRLHIIAAKLDNGKRLGDMKLSSNKRADRLTPALIETWLDGIKDSGKQNTALQVHTRLVGIIENAMRLGKAGENIAAKVKRKRIDAKPVFEGIDLPTLEEALIIAGRRPPQTEFSKRGGPAGRVPSRMWLEFMMSSGLRPGESLALYWSDFDFEERVLSVERTLTRRRQAPEEPRRTVVGETTKTKAGVRKLLLTDKLCEKLIRYRETVERGLVGQDGRPMEDEFYISEQQILDIAGFIEENGGTDFGIGKLCGIGFKEVGRRFGVAHHTVRRVWELMRKHGGIGRRSDALGLVFPNHTGGLEDVPELARQFARLQRQLCIVDADGNAKYTPHSLRHFYASWELKQGTPVLDLAAKLGHTNAMMIHKVYGHLLSDPKGDRARAEANYTALFDTDR